MSIRYAQLQSNKLLLTFKRQTLIEQKVYNDAQGSSVVGAFTVSAAIGWSQVVNAALLDTGIAALFRESATASCIAPCKDRVLFTIDGSVASYRKKCQPSWLKTEEL